MPALVYEKYILIFRPSYDEKLGAWIPYASASWDGDKFHYRQFKDLSKTFDTEEELWPSASSLVALGLRSNDETSRIIEASNPLDASSQGVSSVLRWSKQSRYDRLCCSFPPEARCGRADPALPLGRGLWLFIGQRIGKHFYCVQ
jgi:hypothetical protein